MALMADIGLLDFPGSRILMYAFWRPVSAARLGMAGSFGLRGW
jgi:hypothetical protein